MENRDQQSLDSLLSKYKIRPDKDLGQNFLTDPTILAGIVAAAEVTNLDTVLEIGAGLGHLTEHLAQAAKKVVAVESLGAEPVEIGCLDVGMTVGAQYIPALLVGVE